jgi:hypothetical protein
MKYVFLFKRTQKGLKFHSKKLNLKGKKTKIKDIKTI